VGAVGPGQAARESGLLEERRDGDREAADGRQSLPVSSDHSGAQAARNAGNQTGEVYLGDAEALTDLRLGEFFEEPQMQEVPVTLASDVRGACAEVLDAFRRVVLCADEVVQAVSLSSPSPLMAEPREAEL
jgi:hypothetical protein